MDLLNSGLKALKSGHYLISDMMSEIFLASDEDGQRYVGLENLGNTCYCNSVVQALYFCAPFRNKLLQCYSNGGADRKKNNLLTCLADLFHQMNTTRWSYVSPKSFFKMVIEKNEIFSGIEAHQDAHELLIFLLNSFHEEITNWNNTESSPGQNGEEVEAEAEAEAETRSEMQGEENNTSWVRDIFGGTFTNETRCSCCETVTYREEPFMDLSVEIKEHSSLSSCLNAFSSVEILNGKNKYWCDQCCHLQEAEKKLKIKSPPQVLVCQLKRFKYIVQEGEEEAFEKLFYRVAFPLEFRLPVNSCGDRDADHSLYSLFAVVVHMGRKLNYGHYIALVKSGDQWLKFDDERVELIQESDVQNFFGSSETGTSDPKKAMNAYILFYQTVNGIETTQSSSSTKEKVITNR